MRIQIGVIRTDRVEISDSCPNARHRRHVAMVLGQMFGQRHGVVDALSDQIGTIVHAMSPITRGHRHGHAQIALAQGKQKAKFGKTARACSARPDITVVQYPRKQATAAIVAQHAMTERRIDVYRTAAPGTGIFSTPLRAPERRIEPGRFKTDRAGTASLRGNRCVKDNRAIGAGLKLCLYHRIRLACTRVYQARMPEAQFSMLEPPQSLCLLRTSALGDVTHVVPMVRTLQACWPQTCLTWIIGKLEHKLVGDIVGVEFLVIDKAAGWRGLRALHAQLAGRRFDAILQLQVALRANLISTCVHAPLRIGYDRARSRDLHGLFVNRRITAESGQHVLDAMASFLQPLGLQQTQVCWDIPVPDSAHEFAQRHLPGDTPTLLVSPCSSHALRNWQPERYAAVMDHAAAKFGWRSALCGSPSANERAFGDAIMASTKSKPIDLIGKDTLKQFLALAQRASLILTPDSGPMHMANAAGTPVLGLHAASNPKRSGPYSDRRWCVDRYDAAARKFRGKPASELRWGTKLEYAGVMDLIETEAVVERLEAFVQQRAQAGGAA